MFLSYYFEYPQVESFGSQNPSVQVRICFTHTRFSVRSQYTTYLALSITMNELRFLPSRHDEPTDTTTATFDPIVIALQMLQARLMAWRLVAKLKLSGYRYSAYSCRLTRR